MMSDIGTFFQIMLILFLGFAMCLTFILGDIKDEFNNGFKSMRSLFSAILGELDWEPFDDGTNVNDAVLAFAYFVYYIYYYW